MPQSDVIALAAALAATASAIIAWLALRLSGCRVRISAVIFHGPEGEPRIKMVAINSAPREVEIQFSDVLLKAQSLPAQMLGIKGPEIWQTAHINWTGPSLPHRLLGDAQATWWGDGYMVEYNLGALVDPNFTGQIDVQIGSRRKFVGLVFKDWSNTCFPSHDRPELLTDVDRK